MVDRIEYPDGDVVTASMIEAELFDRTKAAASWIRAFPNRQACRTAAEEQIVQEYERRALYASLESS